MNTKMKNEPWLKAALYRRATLFLCILAPTIVASRYMAGVLPHKGSTILELTIVVVFGILFAWISLGFWTATTGFLILWRKYDRFAIGNLIDQYKGSIDPESRTAILIPICNENVDRVMAGVRASFESLNETGQGPHFDFHILSDSQDPDRWVEEEAAWAEFCRAVDGFNRIFYRRRRVNLKRKNGNVADFCRRFGQNYKYMIVFDADSVMAGQTLVSMVRMMEAQPTAGMVQTVPMAVNRETLIARVQQFAHHVYGPMFSAGLHYWILGDAQYWGHNAIIRVKAFMDYCGLPKLNGQPPLGGDIMSHDFVEAALIRRAGWAVWIAYDLKGSYEEVPPTLLDELKRDRRWCQGNLQHLKIVPAKGLRPIQRVMFLNGVMSYSSALLWLIFLALSTTEAFVDVFRTPIYFSSATSLFPDWPVWYPQWAIALLASTVVLLFLPKVFCWFLICVIQRRAKPFGGAGKVAMGMFIEVLVSTLLAPIRMLFHSKFVFLTLIGRQVGWGGQSREDRGTTWAEAARFHWAGTVLGLVWGATVFIVNRSFFWWLSPILTALVVSIPISVLTSRVDVGQWFKKRGWLVIPPEIDQPLELRLLQRFIEHSESQTSALPISGFDGFIRAVVDPDINSLHLKLLRGRRKLSPLITQRRLAIQNKALSMGPGSLSRHEKIEILYDPDRLTELHRLVWELPEESFRSNWKLGVSTPTIDTVSGS